MIFCPIFIIKSSQASHRMTAADCVFVFVYVRLQPAARSTRCAFCILCVRARMCLTLPCTYTQTQPGYRHNYKKSHCDNHRLLNYKQKNHREFSQCWVGVGCEKLKMWLIAFYIFFVHCRAYYKRPGAHGIFHWVWFPSAWQCRRESVKWNGIKRNVAITLRLCVVGGGGKFVIKNTRAPSKRFPFELHIREHAYLNIKGHACNTVR